MTTKPSSRFWLFAPFIGLVVLTGIYGAFWRHLSDVIPQRIEQAGITFDTLKAHGFPARLSFDVENPHYQDQAIRWTTAAMRLDLMPYNAQKAVLKFFDPHEITTTLGKIHISHSQNIASLDVTLKGVRQFDFILSDPQISGALGRVSVKARADKMALHARRNPTQPQQADIAMTTQQIKFGKSESYTEMTLKAALPYKWLTGNTHWARDLHAGQMMDITSFELKQNAFNITARGRLGADAQSRLSGRLTLDVSDLNQFVDLLARHNIINERMRRDILLVNGFAQFFGTTDRQTKISIPLHFENGHTSLANIPIGPAPRIPLP